MVTPTVRSDLDALRAAIEGLVSSALPGLCSEVHVTASDRSCATVRVFANSKGQEVVYWFQLFVRDPTAQLGVVRRLLDAVRTYGGRS